MPNKRAYNLLKIIQNEKIDALLVTKPENIFYLTSFSADKGTLLICPEKTFFITDFIYEEAASKFFREKGVHVLTAKGRDSFEKTIDAVLRKFRMKRLGFEGLSLNLTQYERIKNLVKIKKLIPTKNAVESLREIKEKKEIVLLNEAIGITAKTLKEVKKKIRPGAKELEIVKYIKENLIRFGGDGFSFEPIVATQPSASQPHYVPGKRKLGKSNSVLIDMGVKLDGYNSDLTRMISLGKISSKFKDLYNMLLNAQRSAIEIVKPGIRMLEIDTAARQFLENKGLGKFFGHSTGHGIGLEIHERPIISNTNTDILKEGMVFTIEPGIYIPGFCGLRIEDTVLVTKNGCEVLTDDIDKSI